MQDKIVVPFTIDEDEVNTLDTVPVTLATVSGSTTMARVPVRLEIWRKAGTAYTVTRPRSTAQMLNPATYEGTFDPDKSEVSPIWLEEKIIVYDTNANDFTGHTDRRNIYFEIPIDNFLNRAGANGLVVMPLAGIAVAPGDVTLMIESLARLASGTGDLEGRVFFDEYPTKR